MEWPLKTSVDFADDCFAGGIYTVELQHVVHAVGVDAVGVDDILEVARSEQVDTVGDDEQ